MDENEQQQHKEQPIIIKKKRGHAGHEHHGGAWKVAYADFVTAMMAFFIVMWILGQSDKVQSNITAYFKDPGAFSYITGKRTIPVNLNLKPSSGSGESGSKKDNEGKSSHKFVFGFSNEMRDSIVNKLIDKAVQDSSKAANRVTNVAQKLQKLIKQEIITKSELKEILSSIKIEMTKEGLRIELIESSESLFFEVGSSKVNKKAKDVLVQLAQEIGKLPNNVEIEGHTDSRKYGSIAGYSNWELSADRANSARRILENSGMWDGQINKVTGYADRKLRTPDNPFDITNRRVSILIKQMTSQAFLPETQNKSGE